MKTSLSFLLASGLTAATAFAAPLTFDFKDPKGVNAMQFHLDSLLEPIAGTASGVTGEVRFDPENPGDTAGRISVATASLQLPNSTMQEHLHSENWLDAAKNPEITFNLAGLEDVKTEDNVTTATARGQFTLKGVTKDITVPVRLTYLEGALGRRINRPEVKGDLLVVRGEFMINRDDYGVQPGRNEDRVSPEVKVTLAIVGSAPQS